MTKERQWPRTAAAEQPKLTTTTAATARSLVVRDKSEFRAKTSGEPKVVINCVFTLEVSDFRADSNGINYG